MTRACPPHVLVIALAACLLRATADAATPATPIPDNPPPSGPTFFGSAVRPHGVFGARVPRHPFMARNGRSNIHDDAYMTDTYRIQGPIGRDMARVSTYFPPGNDCASVTFDRRGRVVSICVGLGTVTLRMFDPVTLELLAEFPLPPRQASMNPFQDFSGGGYFYLDDQDRVVVATNTVMATTSHYVYVVAEAGMTEAPSFALEHDYDLGASVPASDRMTSALPDWSGRIWFVSLGGIVGTLDATTGQVQTLATGEELENSFAVDETGGVFIVSNVALYRFDAGPGGAPAITWREVYPNSGIHKPGQVDAGSGTTPTLMGRDLVAITDNADPMDIVVYRRGTTVNGSRLVCTQPVFTAGASATENSLIGTGKALIVENNYGYTGPSVTSAGGTTSPGIERVDLDDDETGCHTVWHSDEIAPTVVPKLSLPAGLVYTYTKPADPVNHVDSWYVTAIDFRTGVTRWRQLAGNGVYFNNNYAPISIGPHRVLYVGVLGGLVALRDGSP